jgi:hypothetical protein
MILEIPLIEVEIGGSVFNYYYNNVILRADVVQTTTNGTATATGNISPDIAEVNSILTAGGETFEYLMAIKANIALLDTDVPDPLPNNKTLDGTATEVLKTFSGWLVPGAEIWKKDDNTEILFYTNPFAGNPSSYLKGSEIKIINDINPAQIDILTIEAAEIETATGWTKL